LKVSNFDQTQASTTRQRWLKTWGEGGHQGC
jgi:hypothetical protein